MKALSLFLTLGILPLKLVVADPLLPVKDVYMAVRTDGNSGTGEKTDPYDGSSQPKFDSYMKGFGPNTHIHLGPGSYLSNGDTAFSIKPGWNIEGAGMGKTILKLNGNLGSYRKHINLWAPNIDTNDVRIHDLTVDGNYQAYRWPAHDVVGGILVTGNHIHIERVEVINCYGDAVDGLEQFSILIGGPGSKLDTDCVIKDCVTHQYAPGANYTNGPLVGGCTKGMILNCKDDGANHAFGFSHTRGSLMSGCSTTVRSGVGFYIDTSDLDDITIENNVLPSWGIPIQFNSQDSANNIKILDNILESSNSGGWGSAAIVLCGKQGHNFEIKGNKFVYLGHGNSGLILNNGTIYKNLDVENNISNVGLVGAGGVLENVKDGSNVVMLNHLNDALPQLLKNVGIDFSPPSKP